MLWRQKSLVLSVAALLVVACVCNAEAQGRRGSGQGGQQGRPGGGPGGPGGGPGGPGGGPGMFMGGMFGMGGGNADMMLLNIPEVQKELELVDEQINQLTKARDDFSAQMRDMMGPQAQNMTREERMERAESAQKKAAEAVQEILLPHQAERLKQLGVQFQIQQARGIGLTFGDVAAKLGITEEQGESLRTKARELEREMRKKLVADLVKELTPDQQAKYKELVGEPFEFPEMGFGANRPGMMMGPGGMPPGGMMPGPGAGPAGRPGPGAGGGRRSGN